MSIVPASSFYPKLYEWVKQLQKDQKTDDVYVLNGRKFERIMIRGKVRYFVKRTTGDIYGVKSDVAPNTRHWYGTIYRAHLWDWSGLLGTPVNDTTVRANGSYGPYTRYVEV